MSIQVLQYETVLAEYSNAPAIIELLRQHRPYLEMVPSLRRAHQSVLPLPLPTAKVRQSRMDEAGERTGTQSRVLQIACDVAVLMCDPEWKIKTGAEIFLFIHRPDEDFSGLLTRWRQTQVILSQNYEWLMPYSHRHIISEGTDERFPLFVLFPSTPDRISRGLLGASLPFVTFTTGFADPEAVTTPLPSENTGL